MDAASAGFLALPGFALLLLIVVSFGRRVVGSILPHSEEGERIVLGFATGMAALSLLTTALLFASLPVLWILPAALLGGALWARREIPRTLSDSRTWVTSIRSASGLEPFYKALAILFAVLGVVGCLAPETGWDTGGTHFTMAWLRADSGTMVVRNDVPLGYGPGSMHSLYTVGFLFEGETLASLFNLSFFLGGLALARLWARRLAGDRAGILAGIAYLTSVFYVLRTSGGDPEMGQSFYFGIALYTLSRLRTSMSLREGIFAGLGLGLAFGIDYSSGWLVVATASVWVIVRIVDRVPPTRLLAEGAVIGGVAVLVSSCWYVRNYLETGSPIYPYGVSSPGTGQGGSGASFPISLILRDLALHSVVLAAFPAALLAAIRPVRWVAGVVLLIGGVLIWDLSGGMDGMASLVRIGSPVLLPLLVWAGVGIDEALGRKWIVRLPAGALLAGGVLLSLGIHGARHLPKVPAALGLQDRDQYLEGRINSYWAMRFARENLSGDERVLLVEPRPYYLRVPFLVATDGQLEYRFEPLSSAREFRDFLETHRIRFVIHTHPGFARTTEFHRLLQRVPRILEEAKVSTLETRNDCTLYRVE